MKNQALSAFTEGFRGSFYLAAALIVSLVTTVTNFATLRPPPSRKRGSAMRSEPDAFCRREDWP